ncbi:MAG: (d)CMP kinase [Candidatus Latescibacteria bacterium]|nr:(d)CMP kinase [Candidatus Latescibacterota bacterium]
MAPTKKLIITIDGVVGAGKTSTAKEVARQLSYRHIDTGAMYRAVTLAGQRRGVAAESGPDLERLLQQLDIELEPQDKGGRILLDGEDVSEQIRRPEITRAVGPYADAPIVRRALVLQQQALGRSGGIVAEGRDAGTVVFPNADIKVLMVASLTERTRRRHLELQQKGIAISPDQVAADIRQRDRQDRDRDYGASHDPQDLFRLDTTALTLVEQVESIVARAGALGAG